jgi:NAD(P)-dependent dehydrogenase (short-subunit alcohol dehydrogenase family)
MHCSKLCAVNSIASTFSSTTPELRIKHLPVERLPYPVWKEVIETNLGGMFLVTQGALTFMKRGGTIVNNLSIAANRVFAGAAAYNASKHGALGLTNTLREELRPKGIRVIGLLPGATDTDIWKTLWPEAPRSKMMSPATVAQAVVNAILLPPAATVENLENTPHRRNLVTQHHNAQLFLPRSSANPLYACHDSR